MFHVVSSLVSFFDSRNTGSPTAHTGGLHRNTWSPHYRNRWIMARQMIIHCTNLWSVVNQRCDFFLIQVESGSTHLASCDESNFTAKTAKVDRTSIPYSGACDCFPALFLKCIPGSPSFDVTTHVWSMFEHSSTG